MKISFLVIFILFSIFTFGMISFEGEIIFSYKDSVQNYPFNISFNENDSGMLDIPAEIKFNNDFKLNFSGVIQGERLVLLWESNSSDEFIFLFGDINDESLLLDGIHNYKGKRTKLHSTLNGDGSKIKNNDSTVNIMQCSGQFNNYGSSFDNDPAVFEYNGKVYFYENFNTIAGFIKRPDNGMQFKQTYFGLNNDDSIIISYITQGDGSEWVNLSGKISGNKIDLTGSHYYNDSKSKIKLQLNLVEINKSERDKNWVSDLEYLKKELPEKHKNLFFNISQKDFNSMMNEIIGKVSKLNDYQIIYSLREVFSKIGDSHTTFISHLPDIAYPFQTYWFSDGIYIIESANEEMTGKKIINLDNKTIDIISNEMEKFYPNVNSASKLIFTPKLIRDPHVYKFLLTDKKDSLTINTENEEFEIDYLPESVAKLKKNYQIQTPSIPLYLKNREAPFWYEYDNDKRILYCQYNTCWSDNDKNSYPNYDFDKFYDEIVNIVKNNKLDKFIFDVRFNTGGNSSTGTSLIKKISGYKKNIKQSFVIVGRDTFSSAIINSYDMIERLDAVSVGEPTWGQPNSYGEIKSFNLPNSGIKVYYSTKFFRETKENVDSLIPKINLEFTFEDYMNGKDPFMEAVYNY